MPMMDPITLSCRCCVCIGKHCLIDHPGHSHHEMAILSPGEPFAPDTRLIGEPASWGTRVYNYLSKIYRGIPELVGDDD